MPTRSKHFECIEGPGIFEHCEYRGFSDHENSAMPLVFVSSGGLASCLVNGRTMANGDFPTIALSRCRVHQPGVAKKFNMVSCGILKYPECIEMCIYIYRYADMLCIP